MNLVEFVKDQLSSEVTNRLSSLAGSSEVQTKSAIAAAVPALLAALSGAASKGGAVADKLASAVNRVDSELEGAPPDVLVSEPDRAMSEGGNMLSSLLGEGTLSGVISAISKFARIDAAAAKKIVSAIGPLVMGAIARQFNGAPVTGQNVANLLAEQKANIANALPAGLSLAGIPGMPQLGDAARSAVDATQRTAQTAARGGSRVLATVLPLAIIAAAGFFAWRYFSTRPAENPEPAAVTQTANRPVSPLPDSIPDAAKVSHDLTSVYTTATETLGKVTDAESAKAALPELETLRTNLTNLQTEWDKVPETARPAISAVTNDHLAKLKEMIAPLLEKPGIKELLKPILDEIVVKLEAFKS